MTTPTPKGYLNFVSVTGTATPVIASTSWSYGSPVAGDLLWVWVNITGGAALTVTNWNSVRFAPPDAGFSYQLFKRTATGTSADDFVPPDIIYHAAGISFPAGVVEDYTSGAWCAPSSFTVTANGGQALTSPDGLLVYISGSLEYGNTVTPVFTYPSGMSPGRTVTVGGSPYPNSANVAIQTLASTANPGSRTGAVSGFTNGAYGASAMLVFKDAAAPVAAALGWGLGI